MLSVAFFINDKGSGGVDLSDPSQGNPGIGGTDYSTVALAYELAKRGLAASTLIHQNPRNRYPGVVERVCREGKTALPKTINPDFYVVRAENTPLMSRILDELPGTAPVILWAHNHLRWQTDRFLAQCKRVQCIVYVGREQAALASGGPCHFKAEHIPIGLYPPAFSSRPRSARAVYVGNLVPQKGFHRLARLWPQIHRRCPQAALDVIGDGRLYDARGRLGQMGLAHPVYEQVIAKYLGNDPDRYNVAFHGKLSRTRLYEVMTGGTVGLPNPTGFTECCPASSLELSACGAAVVGPRRWGTCDTVLDGVTGYLCATDKDYISRAATLLGETATAVKMGLAGQTFVREEFNFDRVCEGWNTLFERLRAGSHRAPSLRIQGSYTCGSVRRFNSRHHIAGIHACINTVDRAHGWYLKRY